MTVPKYLSGVRLRATGIGSVPHTDIGHICSIILDNFTDIPYWPQFEKVDPRENMLIQFSENLPCLRYSQEKRTIEYDHDADKGGELLRFYEHYEKGSVDYFRIGKEYARGLYAMLDHVETRPTHYLKGQVVGPLTFLGSVMGEGDKALLHDQDLFDAVVKGLAMKGLWQARRIREVGKVPLIFFDEPYLSGFGSAYVPLERNTVVKTINNAVEIVKQHEDALVGVHCCGNTDWSMMLETGIDILSFDSYGFAENFILYPDSIKSFLDRGGIIAWGAVPTAEYTGNCTLNGLMEGIKTTFEKLRNNGIDPSGYANQMLFTPSCGTGLMAEEDSEAVMNLTRQLAETIGY